MKLLSKGQLTASHDGTLNITLGSGKSPPPNCAKKHKVTPGFGIKDLPDCAEKHKGSGLGRASRKKRIVFLDSTLNFPAMMYSFGIAAKNAALFANHAPSPRAENFLSSKSVRQIKNR